MLQYANSPTRCLTLSARERNKESKVPPIQRRTLRKAEQRMLRCGIRGRVRARRLRRDGTVVDDTSALRGLGLELPERVLRADERGCEVHVYHLSEGVEREVFERDLRRVRSGVLYPRSSSKVIQVAI